MQQTFSHYLHAHLAFPDANYRESARSQVGILRSVAFLLRYLAVVEWGESRVPMPPLSIGLNNNLVDLSVNYKFWLDDGIRCVFDTKLGKNLKQLLLQLGWFGFLQLLVSSEQFLYNVGAIGPHVFGCLAKPLSCSWLFRWVIRLHILSSSPVHVFFEHAIKQYDAKMIGAVLNLCMRASWQKTKQPCRSNGGVLSPNNSIFVFCPRIAITAVRNAVLLLAIALVPTNRACVKVQAFIFDFLMATFGTRVGLPVILISADGASLLFCAQCLYLRRMGGRAFLGAKSSLTRACRERRCAPFTCFSVRHRTCTPQKDTLPASSSRCLGDTEHGKVYRNHIRLGCGMQPNYLFCIA